MFVKVLPSATPTVPGISTTATIATPTMTGILLAITVILSKHWPSAMSTDPGISTTLEIHATPESISTPTMRTFSELLPLQTEVETISNIVG